MQNNQDDMEDGLNDIRHTMGLAKVGLEDEYKAPIIAKLLHSLPHYNITFHRTNNTFRPTDEIYLESLGILGSVPAALLIISLFGLLLYLLTRCCDRKPRPAHSITSLKVTLSIVTVLCCAAIGLGLYGNDDLHNGLLEVLTAGRKVDTIISSVRNQTTTLETTLTQKIRPQLVELADIFDQAVSNQTALSQLILSLNVVQGNVTVATNAAGDIRRPLMRVTMTSFLTRGDQWELIRWPGTVAILALLLVLCAVLLVGVARHSRCALILFSVCGLLAVTGSWLMSGIYLSSSVAVGDLCMDPADYLVSEAPTELPTEVLLYYTQCESARSNPFTQRLRESQNAITNARSAMNIVSKISLVLFKSQGLQPKLGAVTADLNTSERLLTHLTALVDCKALHYNYLNATRGLCEGGLLGLVLMLIASFAAAILLTVMVWVDSHTWIYIRKRNDYSQVDEPSYASHQQQPNMHHNHNSQTMSRTLPRNHHNGPPVISGSHTLQHPRNKQHEMMMATQHQQHHQNMRQLGTQTLGRPHTSPGGGGNNKHVYTHSEKMPYPQQYVQQQQHAQLPQHPLHPQQQQQPQHPQQHIQQYQQHPQQYAQAPATSTYSHAGTGPPIIFREGHIRDKLEINGATACRERRVSSPNSTIPIYHQQQMPLNHQTYQQLPSSEQMMIGSLEPGAAPGTRKKNPQNIYHQQSQPHAMPNLPQHQFHAQQIQQQQLPPQPNAQRFYPPQSVSPKHQHQFAVSLEQMEQTANCRLSKYGHSGSATTARRPPHSSATAAVATRDPSDTIPNSTVIDSAMYERDKQIYKCSTMRPGGKFDKIYGSAGAKPSILNCPLPEIPKDPRITSSENGDPTSPPTRNGNNIGVVHPTMTRTLQRPFKSHYTGKAIPPPKIDDNFTPKSMTSPKPVVNGSTLPPQPHPNRMISNGIINTDGPTSLPPPPPNVTSPPPPNATQSPSIPDESNYAVTEL